MLSPLIVNAVDMDKYDTGEIKLYTITFVYNDDSGRTKTRKIMKDNKINLPVSPTRTGYEFKGWWTDKTGGKEIKEGEKFQHSNDLTLYARWEKINIEGKVNYKGYDMYYYDSYFSHPAT